MFSDAEMQLAYKVGNAPFSTFPFPHIYVQDVFPPAFYADLQRNLPDPKDMQPILQARKLKGYDERFVLGVNPRDLAALPDAKRMFWTKMMGWLVGGNFRSLVLRKFQSYIDQRFAGIENVEFYDEALLVQDITNYKLGPHTDAMRKVVTMLFYLPADESQRHLGTSIYMPNDPAFVCPGGPHHERANFSLLHTNPFAPNALFAFLKTNNSFHGVEPVRDPDTRRWLLLYDIFVMEGQGPKPVQKVEKTPVIKVAPKISFTF
jgi:hypothetical protein